MTRPNSPLPLTWPALLLAAAGCNFAVDSTLVKKTPDAGDQGCTQDSACGDAGMSPVNPPDGGMNFDAGSSQPLADSGPVDGGVDTTQKTDSGPEDAGMGTPCQTQTDCGLPHSYCSPSTHTCTAECSDFGCALIPIDSVSGLVAIGETLVWSEYSGRDKAGNLLHNGKVVSWDQHSDPVVLPGGTEGTLLLAWGTNLVFSRDGALFRMPSTGSPSPTMVSAAVGKAWTYKSALYWSQKEGNAQELWMQADVNTAPQRLASTSDGYWIASNGTHATKVIADPDRTSGVLSVIKLADQTTAGTLQLQDNDLLWTDPVTMQAAMDEQYLYFAKGSSLVRETLGNLSNETLLGGGGMPGNWTLKVDGDWVYWAAAEVPAQLGRTHRELLDGPTKFVYEESFMVRVGTSFAVTRKGIYYYLGNEGRLFLIAQPSLPCTTDTHCPADMTCSNKLVCE